MTHLTRADRAGIYALAALLVAIGASMVANDRAAEAFGARHTESPSKLFQRVAGFRTAWLGLAVLTLHRTREYRALGWLLVVMSLNPATDTTLAAAAGGGRRSLVHLPGALATALFGVRLLRLTRPAGTTDQ